MIDDKDLRKIYNPEESDLRKAQLRMLEILICIDRICRKHQIKYWLSSGTLLGAVRHGGFIPWDDDVDIEMMKEDYIKLIKILPKELPSQYVLQDYKTDSHYVYQYAKVRDTHSLIIEHSKVNQSFKYQGLFIDIFPLDMTNPKLSKISSVLFNRLCFGIGGKGVARLLLLKMNSFILNSILFPTFTLLTKCLSNKRLHYVYGISFLNETRKIEDLFPLKDIEFEGHKFQSPKDTDAYLKKLYGDYMTIPEHKDVHLLDGQVKIW